jgi:hypothetical protein
MRVTEDKLLSAEELYRMNLVGSIKARYVVCVGKCVGLRAEDFSSQVTYGMLRKLDKFTTAHLPW